MANLVHRMRSWSVITTAVALLGSLLLGAIAAPVAQAGTTTCRVRNVTQDTHGASFPAMVKAAVDGDRLTVRGTCEGGIVIRADIIIRGVGDPRPVLTGRHRHRAFRVWYTSTVMLRHLAMVGGAAEGYGGGILNYGTLTLTDSVVRGNMAMEGSGGGIANLGTLTLNDSVVRGNTGYNGGGILNWGTLNLTGSVVRENRAVEGGGGGIVNVRGSTLTLTGSVVRDNRAVEGGGIANEYGTVTITESVVRGNRADKNGGGIANSGTLTLRRSSSVTDNTAGTHGGGVWNQTEYGVRTVILRGGSSVTGNSPDDCYGTTAC